MKDVLPTYSAKGEGRMSTLRNSTTYKRNSMTVTSTAKPVGLHRRWSETPWGSETSYASAGVGYASAGSLFKKKLTSASTAQAVVNRMSARIARIRTALANSSWYQSPTAKRLRDTVTGKCYAFFGGLALLVALFLPDAWVICGANSNLTVDLFLSAVMFWFGTEVALLSLVDASYFLSFFFFTDVVGTAAMVFDISWMLGTDATVPHLAVQEEDAKRNLMLIRATRAAKVGARAGRFTRVLRMLRLLPFMPDAKADSSQGIATAISTQLSNLLATRIACLTIILVMVIPLFDIFTFPTHDYSLKAWCQRLSKTLGQGLVNDTLEELQMMVEFYDRYPYYGPFRACLGAPTFNDNIFECEECSPGRLGCQELSDGWHPLLSQPPRTASTYVVHTDSFMVAFNMHRSVQLEAALWMTTSLFIIAIMVFSGLALSSVVTELAVRPLERMMGTVRQIATTVFKYSAQAKGEDVEDVDVGDTREMELLEKVVQKLAVIADLQTRSNVVLTEDMREEDVGVLSMMQGVDVVATKKRQMLERVEMSSPRQKKEALAGMKITDCGLTQELLDSLAMNALTLSRHQKAMLAAHCVTTATQTAWYLHDFDDQALLRRFIVATEKEYLANPFHNFSHAVDVLHGCERAMRKMGTENFLTDLEAFALLVAALGHDLGHPGVNNGYLLEVGHELALQYNDRSPLENMHCAKLYSVIGNQDSNIFCKLENEQYKEARKICIETILHTDMMHHNAMVKDLQMLYQMHSEALDNSEKEVFAIPEKKLLILECILHTADVSNPCRTWEVSHAWAMVCLEEFFAQGDKEKNLGIPVQFLNDRDTLNRPNSQIGFIEFMIAPLFASVIQLWPTLSEFGDMLGTNIKMWEEMWVEETSPAEEEKIKVSVRVVRVRKLLEDAKARVPTKS